MDFLEDKRKIDCKRYLLKVKTNKRRHMRDGRRLKWLVRNLFRGSAGGIDPDCEGRKNTFEQLIIDKFFGDKLIRTFEAEPLVGGCLVEPSLPSSPPLSLSLEETFLDAQHDCHRQSSEKECIVTSVTKVRKKKSFCRPESFSAFVAFCFRKL